MSVHLWATKLLKEYLIKNYTLNKKPVDFKGN